MKHTLIFTSLIALLAGCGGPKNLSDDQRAQLKDYNTSQKTLSQLTKSGNPQASYSTEDLQEMQQLIQGKCTFQAVKSPSKGFEGVAGASITGPQCPIQLTANMEGDAKDMKFSIDYTTSDEKFAKAAKLKSLKLDGTAKIDGMKQDFSITGTSESVKYGNVKFELRASSSFNETDMTMKLDMLYKVEFKDFTVELKTREKEKGQFVLELNGKELTEDEIKDLNFLEFN